MVSHFNLSQDQHFQNFGRGLNALDMDADVIKPICYLNARNVLQIPLKGIKTGNLFGLAAYFAESQRKYIDCNGRCTRHLDIE